MDVTEIVDNFVEHVYQLAFSFRGRDSHVRSSLSIAVALQVWLYLLVAYRADLLCTASVFFSPSLVYGLQIPH